ncbi:MAG: hypothetical protein V4644_00275 [Patescibacteria group bacterium]
MRTPHEKPASDNGSRQNALETKPEILRAARPALLVALALSARRTKRCDDTFELTAKSRL